MLRVTCCMCEGRIRGVCRRQGAGRGAAREGKRARGCAAARRRSGVCLVAPCCCQHPARRFPATPACARAIACSRTRRRLRRVLRRATRSSPRRTPCGCVCRWRRSRRSCDLRCGHGTARRACRRRWGRGGASWLGKGSHSLREHAQGCCHVCQPLPASRWGAIGAEARPWPAVGAALRQRQKQSRPWTIAVSFSPLPRPQDEPLPFDGRPKTLRVSLGGIRSPASGALLGAVTYADTFVEVRRPGAGRMWECARAGVEAAAGALASIGGAIGCAAAPTIWLCSAKRTRARRGRALARTDPSEPGRPRAQVPPGPGGAPPELLNLTHAICPEVATFVSCGRGSLQNT